MDQEQSTLTGYSSPEELEEIPLPEELVSDVLGETDRCAEFAEKVLETSEGFREEVRDDLADDIKELGDGAIYEAISGVDGSYTILEGSGVSIGLCSAVSAGNEFTYSKEVFPAPPSQDITTACQGITTMLEMKSVTETSESMVIYDGSFISALVNLNQILGRRNQNPNQGLWKTVDPLLDKLFYHEKYFLNTLKNQVIVASPKQSPSTHYLKENYEEYVDQFSDRAFFSRVLDAGEYLVTKRRETGTNYGRDSAFMPEEEGREVESFFENQGFYICFFKPEPWTRAYRLEIPNSPKVQGRLEKILRSFASEIIDPSMLEPYPQWLADAMCKKIVEVSEALKDGVENKLSTETDFDPSEVHALLQGYRTEQT